MYLLDTNILLEKKAEEGYVSYPVLKELDGLKKSEGGVGQKARRAIKKLKSSDRFIFLADEQLNGETVDHYLIRIAKMYDYTLLTADLSLHLMAVTLQANCHFFDLYQNSKEWVGIKYLSEEEYEVKANADFDIDKEILNSFYVCDETQRGMRVTEDGLKELNREILIKWNQVKALNIEQLCFLSLLFSDVPIISVRGLYGSGKTFLSLSYAMTMMNLGKKLIVIPNNSFVSNAREVGTVPGDLIEKELMHLGPLIDLLTKSEALELMYDNSIEVLPISLARGRNLENCIVWVNCSPVIPYPVITGVA